MAVSTRSSRVVLICSSEKCACRGERKCWPRELQIPNASCDPVRSSPVSVSLFLSNPPGRQGCMWPHYFTMALHGITDDWGECCRLESTAEGEFWCGEQTPPRTPNCVFLSEKLRIQNSEFCTVAIGARRLLTSTWGLLTSTGTGSCTCV